MEQIENIPLRGSDIRCWGDEPVGSCSIKALYKALDKPPSGPHLPWQRLWVSKLPSKLLFFTWRVLQNRLPTGDKIHKFNPAFSPTCTLCHEEVESIDHLLIHFKVSKSIWSMIPNLNQKPTDFDNFFKWLWSKPTSLSKTTGIFVAWFIWKMRCEHVFTQSLINPSSFIFKSIFVIHEWNYVNFISTPVKVSGVPPDIWIPPTGNQVKLSFDGSFNPFSQCAGIGGHNIRSSARTLIMGFEGRVSASNARG